MAYTVSGSLKVDIAILEQNLEKLELLRVNITAKIQDIEVKINLVVEADNWPDIHEGTERFKKILQAAREAIDAKINRVKEEIKKVLEQIATTENKVQYKFGELLAKFGQDVKDSTIRPKDISPEFDERVSKMSFEDKVKALGGENTYSDPRVPKAIYNSMSPLQKTMYNLRNVNNDIKVKADNARDHLKDLFNGSSSIITDIKNRGNEVFQRIFGSK